MKAIETPYQGHRFRSRLEARWAVFFDALNLGWEYEPEGFELQGGTLYLPDFRLRTPQNSYRWVEVKPSIVTSDRKFECFSELLNLSHSADITQGTGHGTAILVSGSPLDWIKSGRSFCPRCGSPIEGTMDESDRYCFPCDMETPSGGGHPLEANGVGGVAWRPHKGMILVSQSEQQSFVLKVNQAATKAQGARFEHGEQG
jgi:hypothetical protein